MTQDLVTFYQTRTNLLAGTVIAEYVVIGEENILSEEIQH
jgi:hypothetical protein